ncbi:TIGR02594 family protein [Rhodopseudomonas sp. HC1]|uniref:TIGR02594 family protein n=1 Tax=Rhodopseudomonas infernalis TaxID=2897386 RepID=UPI001EE7D133|nr:TIGR02594 family protein [Rhodopseudomonas infernalis]MCG6207411.1 TIGR02594 family protein [Rhodopseudomonas infernalis]
MLEFTAFRPGRVVALVLGIAAIAALASPASARPLHRHHGYTAYHGDAASHRGYHRHRHYTKRYRGGRHARAAAPQGYADQQSFGFQAYQQSQTYQQPQGFAPAGYADPNAVSAPRMIKQRAQRRASRAAPHAQQAQWQTWNGGGGGGSGLVAEARRYIGGNPTGRSRLWCARFMNMVLERSGHRGTGSDMASSFARYGQRVSGPQVGAIAVMSRGKRGGHVGVVTGVDSSGNPIVVSGNHGRRVAESVYSKSRIYAYVMPSS